MHTTITAHQVKIEKKGNYAKADPNDLQVWNGDTLQITSTDGAFRVVFDPWPFKEVEHNVTNPEVLTFDFSGDFEFYCYLTPPGATKELEYPESEGGGHGNVKP